MKIMTRPFTFVVAVLYGAAWIVGPVNVLAAIQAVGEGGNPGSYLSTIVLAFGIILFLHIKMGWFPFHRRA